MAELKKHLSLSEQVDLLVSRGLNISDKAAAEQLLFNTNYYRLSGYLHNFKLPKSDCYQPGLTIDYIKSLYDFDRKLARIIMYALEDVEETLKTRLSYTLTSFHPDDPQIYLRPSIYRDIDQFNRFLAMFNKEVESNAQLPFVKHHIERYNRQFPLWVAVELFTMGNLSAVFNNLLPQYQKALSKAYNTGPDQLGNWIKNLTYTRNHLAHYMRIYNFNFGRTPKTCSKHKAHQWTSYKIFDQLCIAAFMCSEQDDWNNYVIPQLKAVLDEYSDTVELTSIGFPEDWEDILTLNANPAKLLVAAH